MAIIAQPTNTVNTAYRPLVWTVMFPTFTPDVMKNCIFTLYVDGVQIARGRKAVSYSLPSGLGPTATDYYFEIDVQQYLQRYFAKQGKRSTFGTLDAATAGPNTDSFGEIYLTFQYEYLSGTTGKLQTFPAVDTSSFYYAGITTRQNGEDQTMDNYYGIPAVTAAKSYLTNAPLAQDVSLTENAFLSFVGEWSWTMVTTYDSAGVQISQRYFPNAAVAFPEMNTIGIGKPQLDAITTWWSGLAPTWTNAAYYTIESGLGLNLGAFFIFINNSEIRTYNLVSDCSRKLRFFWTNSLGGVDAYNFSFQELGISVASEVFEKPLQNPHLQHDYGKARTNIKADKAYQCSQIFTNAEMAWIKDLFYSVEVYIQNPDGSPQYWRVYLSDLSFVEKKHPGLFEVQFTANLSQDIVTHRI